MIIRIRTKKNAKKVLNPILDNLPGLEDDFYGSVVDLL